MNDNILGLRIITEDDNHSGLLRMVARKPDPSQTDLEVPRPTSSTSFRLSKAAPRAVTNTMRRLEAAVD